MRIGKIASDAGVGVETVRFYERKGLIAQPPRPVNGGFRNYPAETAQRIRFIRQAQELGFSLRETQELLSLRVDPAAGCADVRGQALVKLAQIEGKIVKLERMRRALEDLVTACPGAGPLKECAIVEFLERSAAKPAHAETDSKDKE